MLKDDNTPMIYWNGTWSPICGHYFWDTERGKPNYGATKFCNKMGYQVGDVFGRGSGESYSSDAFRIGKCNENDDWNSCRGGCNDYEVGGKCSENYEAKCTRGQPVKITIECSGGTILPAQKSSCTGELLHFHVCFPLFVMIQYSSSLYFTSQ